MMLATMFLLAQLAGGRPVVATPGLPPTCSPDLPSGTVCVWRGYPVQVPSQQHPDRSILVSVLSTEPPPTPGTSGNLFIRKGAIRIVLEYAEACADADTYEYSLDFGASCPLPGPTE